MWNKIRNIGYAAIELFGPDWLKQLTMSRKQKEILLKSECSKLEKLGENIGLNKAEIFAAIPSNTSMNLQVGTSCLTWCISCLGFLFLLVIGALFMAICPSSNITTTTTTTTIITTTAPTTYVPGTYYGTITPQDFKKRKFTNTMYLLGV